MRVVASVLALWASVPLAAVPAYAQQPVEVGSRVVVTGICAEEEYAPRRVRKVCPKDKGIILAIGPDTLVLQSEETGDSVVMRFGSISRLDLHSGRKSAVLKGLITGTGVGAVVGAVAGLGCQTGGSFAMNECNALETTARGAAVGAACGILVGLIITTDRWEEVPLDQLRVSLAPQRDGRFGLGLSVAF
jgi:hypothetical protein